MEPADSHRRAPTAVRDLTEIARVEVVVGVGSWLVFLVDLVVQLRIDPNYLHRRRRKVDVGIVLITFPIYLIPGITGGSAILLLARLARVIRGS